MKVIGMISGTSLDGVDAAVCEIHGFEHPTTDVLSSITIPYSPTMREQLLQAIHQDLSRVDLLCRLGFDLADFFAEVATQAIQEAKLTTHDIDLISAHGHTAWHEAEPDGHIHSTFQIMDGPVLAERTGITVINNLRTRDVANGGHGAPVVTYFDWVMLRHDTINRVIQNIGGIGNVAYIPAKNQDETYALAFDTGPGNVLIDEAVRLGTQGELTFDKDGEIAATGTIIPAIHEWLIDQIPYYRMPLPKTTGRELFTSDLVQEIIHQFQPNLADLVTTMTYHTTQTIADAYQTYIQHTVDEVIVAGGGTQNPTLMRMLGEVLAPVPVKTHEDIGVPSEYKEAMVFALMGYLTWHNLPSTVPAFTYAKKPSISGQISPSENYRKLISNLVFPGS